MPINKINTNDKKIDKDGIIYALIFVLYFAVAILIFVYAVNSLRAVINTALNTPDSTEVENKYGQLDLENYSLVAGKLGLQKNIQEIQPTENPIATTAEISTETVIASSSLPEVSTTTATTTEAVITDLFTAPKTEDKRPTIIITNSTTKSGLAATLKSKLVATGYTVLSTGNSRPALSITTIKVKNTINQNSSYLDEIKKIVDSSYDFVILDLDSQAKADIEIIIGNK